MNIWNLLGAGRFPSESKKKLGIVALLYFIQGSPTAILWEVLPVYFRIQGVSLSTIGGLRFLELPYSLKVFWSPIVHRFGDRRIWVVACMLAIVGVVIALAWVDVRSVGWVMLLLILALTTLSATQDIAIDSYTVGMINREEQGGLSSIKMSRIVFNSRTISQFFYHL